MTKIQIEFPSTDKKEFLSFIENRGYHKLANENWQ